MIEALFVGQVGNLRPIVNRPGERSSPARVIDRLGAPWAAPQVGSLPHKAMTYD